MSEIRTTASGSGIGFTGALFLLFLGLKLTGHIGWSWWWVTAPLWAGFCLVVVVAVLIFISTFVVIAWDEWRKKR
jgi:hypothetical protein